MHIQAQTGALPLNEAKTLWKALTKSGREYTFEEKGCKGGAEVEIKKEGIEKNELLNIQIPAKTHTVDISTSRHDKLLRVEELSSFESFEPYFLANINYPVPHYGWWSKIVVTMVPAGLNVPVCFVFEVNNALKVFGRSYDLCHAVEVLYMPHSAKNFHEKFPEGTVSPNETEVDEEKVAEVILGICERFEIPREGDSGVFEVRQFPTSRGANLDPQASVWGWKEYEQMMRTIAAESPCAGCMIWSLVNPGFLIGADDLVDDAAKLVKHVVSNSAYDTFDFRYNATMSMAWKDREKLRKKWKKPILHEVGTLNFKNGSSVDAKVIIEKEGYVFVLEFQDADALKAFGDSKLRLAADWSVGE